MFKYKGLHNNLTRLLIAVYLLVGFDVAVGASLCHRNDTSRPPVIVNAECGSAYCASQAAFQVEGCGPCIELAPIPPSIKPSVRLNRDVPQKTATAGFLDSLYSRRGADSAVTNETFRQPLFQTAMLQNLSTVVLRH